MTQRPLPFGIEELPDRRRTPRPTWRQALFALIVGLGLLLILLPSARAQVSVTADCPPHDLRKGDTLVVTIESRADGKPGVKSCRVMKLWPRDDSAKKGKRVKVNT